MSFLADAKKPEPKAPMITLVGSPGAGKTTLGAMFPNPIFIQAEDGSATFDDWDEDKKPVLLPAIPQAVRDESVGSMEQKNKMKVSSKEILIAQLRELATAEHDFKTLIIDSATALNKMLEHEIALRDDAGNVADAAGGFHKGYTEVASWHSDIIYYCDVIRKRKGMTIVFLAHQGIEKIKLSPDGASEYAIFSLDMHKHSASLYVANSDAVIYIKKEGFVSGAETNKKGQTTKFGRMVETGARKLVTSSDGQTGYIHAKNRFGMAPEIDLPMGENPLLQSIKFLNQ